MKTISSVDTDPKKSTSMIYYGWVNIRNSRVHSISNELGREGGEIWSRSKGSLNGNLVQCMASIGRNWPNLYTKVRRLCPKDKLPAIRIVAKKANLRELEMLNDRIATTERELGQLKNKRRKLKE